MPGRDISFLELNADNAKKVAAEMAQVMHKTDDAPFPSVFTYLIHIIL